MLTYVNYLLQLLQRMFKILTLQNFDGIYYIMYIVSLFLYVHLNLPIYHYSVNNNGFNKTLLFYFTL